MVYTKVQRCVICAIIDKHTVKYSYTLENDKDINVYLVICACSHTHKQMQIYLCCVEFDQCNSSLFVMYQKQFHTWDLMLQFLIAVICEKVNACMGYVCVCVNSNQYAGKIPAN